MINEMSRSTDVRKSFFNRCPQSIQINLYIINDLLISLLLIIAMSTKMLTLVLSLVCISI